MRLKTTIFISYLLIHSVALTLSVNSSENVFPKVHLEDLNSFKVLNNLHVYNCPVKKRTNKKTISHNDAKRAVQKQLTKAEINQQYMATSCLLYFIR